MIQNKVLLQATGLSFHSIHLNYYNQSGKQVRSLRYKYFRPTYASLFEANTYDITTNINNLVSSQLSDSSPLIYISLFFAGLLTSFSPCMLSVLPLTIGYITGFSPTKLQNMEQVEDQNDLLIARSFCFYLGLATTLTFLGMVSVSLGRAYGQIGIGLPLVVSVFAIAMGLNLLQVIRLQFPSLRIDFDGIFAFQNGNVRAYVIGATFALAASPCSTPVLATVLAYCAGNFEGGIVKGGMLLFCYSTGYVFPLLMAASFAGTAGQMLKLRKYSQWITPASGILLVAGGSYSLLSRIIPT